MPVFQVDLEDGRSFEIEADQPPGEQDVLDALGEGVGFDNRTRQKGPLLAGTDAEFLARQSAMSNPESMGMVDKVLANPLLGGVTEFAADVPRNLYNLPAYGVNALAGKPVMATVERGMPVIPELLPSIEKLAAFKLQPSQYSVNPGTLGEVPAGLAKGTEDIVRGLFTPENLMSLGAVKSPELMKAVATLFGLSSVAHLPESSQELGRLSVEGTPAEIARAALNTAAQAAIAGHVATGGALRANKAYQERPLTPEVLPPLDSRPVAPTERQITLPDMQRGGYYHEGVIDLEPIKTGEGTMYKAPTDVQKQIEGPKGEFVGDALGRVLKKEDVNPLGVDVRQPGVGSEPYNTLSPKKQFEETPPLIGQGEGVPLSGFPAIEAKLNEVLNRITEAERKIVPSYQAAGEPKQGGQISFTASAGANSIPNARQTGPDLSINTVEVFGRLKEKGFTDRNAFRLALADWAKEMGVTVGENSGIAVEMFGRSLENGEKGAVALYNKHANIPPQVPSPQNRGVWSPLVNEASKASDAASLPAGAKMIGGEGQSSGQGIKSPQIEDGNFIETGRVGPEGVFYGSELTKSKNAKVIKLPRNGQGVKYYEGTENEGTGSGAPVADAVDRGQIQLPEDVKKLITENKLSDETWDTDLAGLIALKRQGVTIAHFPDKHNPSQVVSVDLRNFDEGRALQELKQNLGVKTPTYDELVAKLKSIPNTMENFPKKLEIQKQIEALKNENGGMPPGKKSGSTVEPDQDAGESYGSRQYGGIFFLDPKFWSENFGSNSHVGMDAKQLYNRVKNKLNEKSNTWKNLDTEELRKFVFGKEKITPKEFADFVSRQEQEQKKVMTGEQEKWWGGLKESKQIETHAYGMEGKVSEAKKEYDRMTHEWWDNLSQADRGEMEAAIMDDRTPRMSTPENTSKAIRYAGLRTKSLADEASRDTPRATSYYNSVSALPTNEPMPDWTATKSGKNVQRVDVVIPRTTEKLGVAEDASSQMWTEAERKQANDLWQPDNLHENLPNTLGWAMIQYKTGPKGEKIAMIAEAQSRWGQELREKKAKFAEHVKSGRAVDNDISRAGYGLNEIDHPLLRDYNRLILKAAIEQARKEGATHIMVSDSKSALMTEMLDTRYKEFNNKETAEHEAGKMAATTGKNWNAVEHGGKWYITEHEKGFDFAYDTALPKIAEELTGSKGEKVSLGEHKNALNPKESLNLEERGKPRSNLIFRNPDGTPKTSVSGMMYPIEQPPTEVAPTKPSGIGGAIQAAVEKNKEAGSIPNLFNRKNRPVKSSDFQYTLKLKSYADEVTDATTPRGIGMVPGLSRLFDPRAYRNTPDGKAIIANAVMAQKGANYTALWLESQKDVQRAFETDERGMVTLANGNKSYMSDVIEGELRNPGSRSLTPGQKSFIQEWKQLREKIVSMAQAEGVKHFVDPDTGEIIPLNESYFPRPAYGKEGIKQEIKDSVRKQVGGKQFFMKGRQFVTEREGVEVGKIKYEPDEFSRIGKWMTAVYKAIADTRMANDPSLAGRSIKAGQPKFLEEGMVFQPAFSGRVFPIETAKRLNKYYGETTHSWVKALANVNDFLKAFQFSVDVSAPLNQGLPLMGVNPYRWAKATVKSYAALADDRILSKYIQEPENSRVAREIVANGGSLARLQDFLAGAEEGKLAHKIAPIRASARSMGTFLSIAKIELYKAFEKSMKPGDTKADLVEAVENAVLSGKMEGLGLQQGRALGERLLFNAPSYIRGAVNIIAQAGQGKISGKVARRALIGMGVAIMAQMYALYKLKGMSDDEIEKRFDPTKSQFLRYPHEMSNGRMKEISYGNILIGIARVAGDTVNYVSGEKTLGSGTEGNPWLRWLSYRKSPLGNLVWQIGTGRDFQGEEISATRAVGESVLPVSLSALVDKGTKESKTTGVLAQGLGLSAYDESAGAFKGRKQDEIARAKYGMPYEKLTANQRRQVTGPAEKETDKLGEKPTPRMIMNVEKQQAERKKQMVEGLTTETQKWLKENNLDVSDYQNKTTVNKKEITLANNDEREKLQELMTKHTQDLLGRMMKSNRKYTQEDVNDRLELAHRRAWTEMKRSLGKPKKK